MRTTLFYSLSFLLCIPLHILGQRITLAEALQEGKIKLEIQYTEADEAEKEIQFYVQNLEQTNLDLILDSGHLIHPNDSTIQEFIIASSKLFSLKPKGNETFLVHGLCIEGSKGGPSEGDIYVLGEMAKGPLFEVVKEIEKEGLQDKTGQNAIWAITERADIAGIYNEDSPDESGPMAEFVARLLDQEVPWYNVVYRENEQSEQMFTGDVARIHAEFGYTLLSTSKVTLGIYKANGTPLQMYFEDLDRPKGRHNLKFKFEASGLEHGTYYVRLFVEGELVEDRPVKL